MSRIVNITDSAEAIPSGYSSSNSSYSSISSSYPITNAYTDTSSTSYAYITCTTGSRASTYISFTFDFSEIPAGATITSVTAKAKGRVSSTSYISTAVFQLYANTTAKGSSVSYRTTSTTTYNLTSTGSWTRSEISNLQLRATATRGTSNTSRAAYIYFYGAEVTVSYSYQQTFYEITASSSSPNIVVEPPNAEVENGDDTSIRITGDSIKVVDNGIDVTGLLVEKQYAPPSYVVNNVTGASYGFTLTNGWYTSQNAGVTSSAALCRVNFDLPVPCNITFTYINYAEAAYDFGVFSKLDTELSTDPWVAGSNSGDTTTDAGLEERRLNTSAYNSLSQQTLTYSNVRAGEHFIDVKFGKDQGTNSNNDNLQFKVAITALETVPTGSYYQYNLVNVTGDHTIVVSAGGNKIFIKKGGVWIEADTIYVKDNGTWKAVDTAYLKENGVWVQKDKSAIFDSRQRFLSVL